MFIALKKAQQEAGAPFLPGGVLHLRLKGEEPHKDTKKSPIKLYEAKYTPPAPGANVFRRPATGPQPAAAGHAPSPQQGLVIRNHLRRRDQPAASEEHTRVWQTRS